MNDRIIQQHPVLHSLAVAGISCGITTLMIFFFG